MPGVLDVDSQTAAMMKSVAERITDEKLDEMIRHALDIADKLVREAGTACLIQHVNKGTVKEMLSCSTEHLHLAAALWELRARRELHGEWPDVD